MDIDKTWAIADFRLGQLSAAQKEALAMNCDEGCIRFFCSESCRLKYTRVRSWHSPIFPAKRHCEHLIPQHGSFCMKKLRQTQYSETNPSSVLVQFFECKRQSDNCESFQAL